MKAKYTIIAMLMAISFGALEANAQSARTRGERTEKTERTTVTKQREVTPQRQSKRTTEVRKATPQRSQPAKVTSNRASNTRQQAKPQAHRSSVVTKREVTKVSTTTRNNPRSNYSSPARVNPSAKTFKNPGAVNRGSSVTYGHAKTVQNSRSVSTVHTTHHYYPTSRVKIHVHPNTYHGHYKVLYYPRYSEIVWNRPMYRYYADIYPGYNWHYNYGYRVQSISVFDARYNVGEIARVYGRVYATWYNQESDDLLLFFGGEYPQQEFTMIIPGNIARRYAWKPERYFLGQHIVATGLISTFEGKAEMIIKKKKQLDVY